MAALNQPDNECCICYDAIGEKNNCITPCGHAFCFECMMKSLGRSNTCPCCRAVLQEKEEENSDEDDYDSEDIEDIEDSDDDDSMQEDPTLASPDVISEQLTKLGYTMSDVLALYLNRIDRNIPRNTRDYTNKLIKDFATVVNDADMEEKRSYEERGEMGGEDTRTLLYKTGTVFDIDPLFTLSDFLQ
jgi:hypothetical protein